MRRRMPIVALLWASLPVAVATGQEPEADAAPQSRAEERTLPALPQSRFFVVPGRGGQAPAAGRPLLLVLPGGDGSAEFLPFVEGVVGRQLPPTTTLAMLVAPQWTATQEIVWPTAAAPVPGMRYGTEDYVRAVIAELGRDGAADRIDRNQVHLLAWSSSGPAVYALLRQPAPPCRGAYIAMSVFPAATAADFAGVRGLRLLLDHSAADEVTTFPHCRTAFTTLTAAGAVVQLSTYFGGHGWQGEVAERLRRNLTWLFSEAKAAPPKWPAELRREPPPTTALVQAAQQVATAGELLANGDFEQGTTGWRVLQNSGKLQVDTVADAKVGKQALHLQKTGGAPLDVVLQTVTALPKSGKVQFAAWVRAKAARNAWVKVFVYGEGDEPLHEDVDVCHCTGDQAWQRVEKSWDVAGATRVVVQVVMLLDGELWLDGASLRPAK